MTGRPRLHLTPREGWINDPLGLTHADGTYHLFFQHVPGATVWDPGCHWGHATSTDLLHWEEQEVALAPGDGDEGCWSGSVVVPGGGDPVLFYTSVRSPDLGIGVVRTARPRAGGWADWTKDEHVTGPPDGVPVEMFRDPCVLADGDGWRMLVGAGLSGGRAAVLGFTSPDLSSWRYDGVVAERSVEEHDPVWTGSGWECPQLLALGGRHVLLVSVWHADELQYVAYAVGDLVDGRFTGGPWRRLTWGPLYYAPCAFVDAHGARGLVHWLRGTGGADAGWAGALSVPHRLALAGDRLLVTPHPALEALRRPGTEGDLLDLTWSPRARADPLRLLDRSGAERAVLARDGDLLTLTLPDGSASGAAVETVPHDAVEVGAEVRVLVDGPLLEVFAGSAVLAVVLPGEPGPLRPEPLGDALTVQVLAPPSG